MDSLPVIDIAALVAGRSDSGAVAGALRRACEESGFFYVVGHGVAASLEGDLERLSREFFSRPIEEKLAIRMDLGGRAWRGYFPVGAELTSGKSDLKEGIYFGAELPDGHPRVRAGVPLHGANLFPAIPGFRETVLAYIDAMTQLGHTLMRGLALSLGLDEIYFEARYTKNPLILFRIFNYPPAESSPDSEWGVGEHTDYGILTILKQDHSGGLEVRTPAGWIAAPPIPASFICNIGDMLDRMTGGRYRSTPHRVRNTAAVDRLSFPFFFDPDFDVRIEPIVSPVTDDRDQRWDRASVHTFEGTYGDYVLGKVAKVFPQLRRAVF